MGFILDLQPMAAVTDASVQVGAARPWHENHDESGDTDGVTAVRDRVHGNQLSCIKISLT